MHAYEEPWRPFPYRQAETIPMRIPSLKELRALGAEACRQSLEMPLYSAGISLYRLGVKAAGIGNPKARLLDHGLPEVMPELRRKIKPGDKVVWVHCASLGEFEQGRPLIEKIKSEHPDIKVLLTFFSPSGYEVRKNYAGADCVTYLPFDTPLRVRRFLDCVRPVKAVFIKYEIWRNYLHELYRRQIPTYLVSAVFRKEQKFFRHGWEWYGLWLKWFTHIFVQDQASVKLLEGIGVKNVTVTGDTRFDRVAHIKADARKIPLLERFLADGDGGRKLTMMAGSSWEPDEDVYAPWFDAHPDVKLVVAPHEFDNTRLDRLKARFRNGAVLLSELSEDCNPALFDRQVLIIDCYGLLSSAYAYCDMAYVGGGFGVGIHNINEPAVFGIPVVYGPNHMRFNEALEMARIGCGIPVAGRDSFEHTADALLVGNVQERRKRGKWAADYINAKTGATDRVYALMGKWD